MPPGSSVGPYRLLHRLGAGGMGEVWLAEDPRLHRQVALKMVRPADDRDEAARARLRHEAQAAAALNHPHIATVHDVLEDQGEVVIVFEYVEGETLHQRIARGRIPAPEAVDIATQIARALSAAHAHGIVHRDLKPSNIIIAAGQHVKVLDFGIARMLTVGSTQSTGSDPQSSSLLGFVGTASYAAPEQMVSSAVDERADLYALGVVLFEMISGERPFVGHDPVQLASAKLGKDAPPLSSTGQLVPPALEQLVSALLEREREKRPASATNVITALRAIYDTPDTTPIPRPRVARPMVVMAASILAVLLAGVGVWQFRGHSVTPSTASAPPVVAVLPLANVSGDPSRDFIAAGIAESLISSLASLPTVTVLSRASVTEARGRVKDLAALTKDLGATYLVEGSVQESAGTLRVSLNLVRPDRSVEWGDSVEGKFEQVFDLQSRLASALTNALSVAVRPEDRKRMETAPTTNVAALSLYWQGRALMERRDLPGNLSAAIQAFTQATVLDPGFATAHAALGEGYWQRYVETRDQSWVTKATDAGLNALRLDAQQPQVRYTLALTLAGSGKVNEAAEELRKTLAIQPNYEDARRQLGQVLARQGHIDEAVAEYRKAIELRPAGWANWSAMGLSLYQAAKYEEAVVAFTKVTELHADNFQGFQQLGTAYQSMGNYDAAIANYNRALAIRPNPQAYTNLGVIHHLRGHYEKAVEAYRRALELRPNSHVTWRNIGDSYTRLGRKREALEAYGRAIAQSEAELKVDPRDAGLLSTLAVYLAKAKRPADADARIFAAVSMLPSDPLILVRLAEVHALNGRPTEAVAALKKSIANGMTVVRVREEEDFDSLRKVPAFQSLVGDPR